MKLGDKNPESRVSWCWKQKRGIKLEEPNDNLCKAYIEKSKSALNILDSAIEKDEIDWMLQQRIILAILFYMLCFKNVV